LRDTVFFYESEAAERTNETEAKRSESRVIDFERVAFEGSFKHLHSKLIVEIEI